MAKRLVLKRKTHSIGMLTKHRCRDTLTGGSAGQRSYGAALKICQTPLVGPFVRSSLEMRKGGQWLIHRYGMGYKYFVICSIGGHKLK